MEPKEVAQSATPKVDRKVDLKDPKTAEHLGYSMVGWMVFLWVPWKFVLMVGRLLENNLGYDVGPDLDQDDRYVPLLPHRQGMQIVHMICG